MLDFSEQPLWLNVMLFVAAAAIVWWAGSKLSVKADVIASRTGLGHAFVGLFLLASATSLPEIATTATAASLGNAPLVTGNLLGGILMQTTVLAVMDWLLVRRGVLTFFAPDAKLMIHGVTLVALLSLVVAAIAVGSELAFWGMSIWTILIFACYLLILWTTYSGRGSAWEAVNAPQETSGTQRRSQHQAADEGGSSARDPVNIDRHGSNWRLYGSFAGGAAAILAAGFFVARVGDAIARQTGLGSTLVGAILLALATSLPEISTTAKAVKFGAFSMAISNIFGSNAFNASLLLLGDILYREGPILHAASGWVLLLTALAIFATCTHLWGMLERKNQTILGMGVPSLVVILVYIGGLAVGYAVWGAQGQQP